MTEQRDAADGWFARWREHRRDKRQQALERRYFEDERANPTTSAYVSAENHARRVDAYTGGSDFGGMGDSGGGDG
ncbi:hypothetical protein BH20ACT17_BH20ACT17_13050 [soil metagenome]